jgi:hypothetical protein
MGSEIDVPWRWVLAEDGSVATKSAGGEGRCSGPDSCCDNTSMEIAGSRTREGVVQSWSFLDRVSAMDGNGSNSIGQGSLTALQSRNNRQSQRAMDVVQVAVC